MMPPPMIDNEPINQHFNNERSAFVLTRMWELRKTSRLSSDWIQQDD